jgi:hypothetical protein
MKATKIKGFWIAGMIAIGSSMTFGQKSIDTIPMNQIAKDAVQAALVDSERICVKHNPCQDDSLLRELKATRQYSFIGTGFYEANLKELNSKLDSSGISGFEPAGFSLAFGGHLEIRKLILEGGGSGLIWGENIDNGLRTSLYAANINGHLGVNLLPEDMIITLSPYAGLGLGMNGLRICNDKKTLNQAIENSDPNVTIWQGSFLTQIGVAIDVVVASPDKQKGYVVGIRGGYQFAPLLTSWYSDDTPITDVPDIKQSGVFVKLILGGWKPHRHKHHCCEK